MYQGSDLETIMPHKRNMVLISRVIAYDSKVGTLTAEVDINAQSMFFNHKTQQVPVWVGIEYMAQSIAALSGIYKKESSKILSSIGFIIGARNYKCFVNGFKINKTITIKVTQLFLDVELGSFSCEILALDKILATTELNVFQPQSIEKFTNT